MNLGPPAQAKFLALLQEHRALLYKVARVFGRSPAQRDDLVQEAIAQLWGAYPRYDEQLRFSTWMYRIALNVAISWRRRERTQTQHLVPVGEELLDIAQPANALTSDAAADVELLYSSIEQFDDLNKALLLLYLDSQSHQEISLVLGISQTNVATKISRLKDRLREQFRAAGHL
jgi:RNA polymerase sigma factor (sigma-70 family)